MTHNAAFYTGNKQFSLETTEEILPQAGEVQIDVAYCGICGTDLHVYQGHMDQRIGYHRVIGHEMSGTIRAMGAGVEGLAIGNPVVVRPLSSCGECHACIRGHEHVCQNLMFLGLDTHGAFQQRWTVPAYCVHAIPPELSLDHAALVEPVAVAVHDVRLGRVSSGEDVLVIGGGPIGLLIAMVSKAAGAKVTMVEINKHRLIMAAELGFNTVDPTIATSTERLIEDTDGKGMDVVFEVSGAAAAAALMTEVAAVRGRIVMVAIHAQKPAVDLFQFFWREIEMIGARVYEPQDYEEAIRLVAADAIDSRKLITSVRDLHELQASFEELVADPKSMKTLIRCT